MGLINKVDMVCLSPVGYGVWLTFRALALRRSRRRANARNVSQTPYPTGDKHTISTLLIKPIFSVLAHAEKQFFSKLVFESFEQGFVKNSTQFSTIKQLSIA